MMRLSVESHTGVCADTHQTLQHLQLEHECPAKLSVTWGNY